MKTKKPDIFLGITMGMLVLAAVLCILILKTQKSKNETTTTEPPQIASTDATNPFPGGSEAPNNTGSVPSSEHPTQPPKDLSPINDAQLKSELDESLRGLTSEWQVMVIDPAFNTEIGSAVNCRGDDWMTANRMAQVFIMGTVFQQAADGKLELASVLDDVKAMINADDTYAADRLTEAIGSGDASKGREAVKAFAVDNGLQLGFNRSLSGSGSQKNYVKAEQTAKLLNMICRGELVSEEASRQMLEILLTPVDGLEIETGLLGEDLRYGFVVDVESNVCVCAMGVVQNANRSFVISVVCNGPVTIEGAKNKVTELIKLTAPYFAE